MRDCKSTILLEKETRTMLSKIGRKNQTYDQIIRELIEIKNKVSSLEINGSSHPSDLGTHREVATHG